MFAKSFHIQAILINNHKEAHFQAQNHINLSPRDPIMHLRENCLHVRYVFFLVFLVDSLEVQSSVGLGAEGETSKIKNEFQENWTFSD